jgi:hypothetical protein
MKKIHLILMAMAVFWALFAAACSTPAAQPAVQDAPAVEAQPQTNQEAPAAQFAPACQAAASCDAPAVTDTEAVNTYCVQKIPYQNIMLPPGTTFESLDSKGELKCADSGTVVDGKNVISCTGKELWTYELKLTNTACGSGSSLQAGTTSCADGQGYDAANNCCAPLTTGSGGSVVIKVNIGACPIK